MSFWVRRLLTKSSGLTMAHPHPACLQPQTRTILVYTKGEDYTFNADAVRNHITQYHQDLRLVCQSRFRKNPDLERGKVRRTGGISVVAACTTSDRLPDPKTRTLIQRIILPLPIRVIWSPTSSAARGRSAGGHPAGSAFLAVIAAVHFTRSQPPL